MPRELARAGFEVSLLAPRNSLTEKSRFVARTAHLPDNATPALWAYTFATMVIATSPQIILPCDDMAFRLLAMFVLTRLEAMNAATYAQVASLVRQSLGDSAYYRTSVDKTLLMPAADALGIRVPRYIVTPDPDAIASFAATLGYPVVLKAGYGSAGDNVAICSDQRELSQAFSSIRRARAMDFDGAASDRMLVQAHIPGVSQYYSVAAWRGKLLAGYANDKLVAEPWPTGPATVVRLHQAREVRGFAERLVEAFDMSGMLSVECKIHEHTGEPYLLEINRRFGPSTFRGGLLGVDLCAALHAALHGLPSQSGTDLGENVESVRVNFPQEWLRDPESPWLREYPVDVPWDDPELIKAMLALRHER